jgi:ABC-type transport system substrate-binding protein
MSRRRNRSVRLALLLGAAVTLAAAPAVSAVEPFIIPAGLGCSFDFLVEPVHKEHAGDRFPIGFGNITMTNMETGATYLQRSRYQEIETFDPLTNTVELAITGRIWIQFYPGDQGPDGEVGEPGAALAFSGKVQLTIDADTDFYTAFSYQGRFTDLCAELAG